MVFFLLCGWRILDLFVMEEKYSQSYVLSWKYFLQKEIVERLQEAGGRWWWLFQVKTSFCIILSKLFQIKTSSKYVFFLESSWSDEDIQGKVGRLELNSYELHSTITGGFRWSRNKVNSCFNHGQILWSTLTNQLSDLLHSFSKCLFCLHWFLKENCFSRASFPLSFLLNHSCLPNCIHLFTR